MSQNQQRIGHGYGALQALKVTYKVDPSFQLMGSREATTGVQANAGGSSARQIQELKGMNLGFDLVDHSMPSSPLDTLRMKHLPNNNCRL